MSTLSESISVDVPARFADREWSEFMFRRLVGHYMADLGEITWSTSGDESDAESGLVKFSTADDRLTAGHGRARVRAALVVGFEAEEATVRRRLRDDLQNFGSFLARRCEEESCRDA